MDDPHAQPDDTATAGPEEIAQAVTVLRAGGVVAFPTETVYGLGADALNERAVARVFELKGRPANNPLIVHVSGEAMARRVVSQWPEAAARLARKFWPGPLTLVLPKAPEVPSAVTAGGPTVGVRCPDHHVTLSLLEAFGGPLVGPSANRSGRVSPTTSAHVREGFGDAVMVLEGGPCRAGIESTVVSLADDESRVLRPGVVSYDQLCDVLGRAIGVVPPSPVAPGIPAASPGMQEVHYAPVIPAVLFETADFAAVLRSAHRVTVLTHTGLTAPHPHHTLLLPQDGSAYAARFYAALRAADATRPSLIAIERPPETGPIWEAIADRLRRATRPFKAT
jgi:L-threonylcarbamoyladenylate synthase